MATYLGFCHCYAG